MSDGFEARLYVALLTLLFVGLKLAGSIDWSWWWVLSPIWLPPAVALFLIFTAYALVALWELITRKDAW